MTVASIPMDIRGRPRQSILGNLRAAQDVAAADHDAEAYPEPVSGDEIGGEAIDRRLMDAEFFRTAQGFAGELDDHASVFRLRHEELSAPCRAAMSPAPNPAQLLGLSHLRAKPNRRRACTQCVPASAATSPPKSPPGRSMPSPSAKRTKPATLIGAPTLPSLSLSACATLFLSSKMKG